MVAHDLSGTLAADLLGVGERTFRPTPLACRHGMPRRCSAIARAELTSTAPMSCVAIPCIHPTVICDAPLAGDIPARRCGVRLAEPPIFIVEMPEALGPAADRLRAAPVELGHRRVGDIDVYIDRSIIVGLWRWQRLVGSQATKNFVSKVPSHQAGRNRARRRGRWE